jgi:hypothetical protein
LSWLFNNDTIIRDYTVINESTFNLYYTGIVALYLGAAGWTSEQQYVTAMQNQLDCM